MLNTSSNNLISSGALFVYQVSFYVIKSFLTRFSFIHCFHNNHSRNIHNFHYLVSRYEFSDVNNILVYDDHEENGNFLVG